MLKSVGEDWLTVTAGDFLLSTLPVSCPSEPIHVLRLISLFNPRTDRVSVCVPACVCGGGRVHTHEGVFVLCVFGDHVPLFTVLM